MVRTVALLLSLLVLAACETVPITGRQQINLYGDQELSTMAAREYRDIIRESTVIRTGAKAQQVQKVGNKIKDAVTQYFRQNGQEAHVSGYRWEFNLLDEDEVNAFCLPGGKVAIYSGIMDVTQSEAGLAVVVGHEVAHAIANHGNERMSQSLLLEVTGAALSIALAGDDPAAQEMFSMAYGIGTSLAVALPFSRMHESEADRLGLIFMAMAGYDPHEAPRFWARMAAANDNDGAPEFLSTHPSDQTRIADLQSEIAEAMRYYRGGSGVPPTGSANNRSQSRADVSPNRPERKASQDDEEEDSADNDTDEDMDDDDGPSAGIVVNKVTGSSQKARAAKSRH